MGTGAVGRVLFAGGVVLSLGACMVNGGAPTLSGKGPAPDAGGPYGDAVAPPPPPSDGGWVPAAHTPFAAPARHSGTILAAPDLVTITYDGYRWQSQVEAFGSFVVTSNWLSAVGKDYGVGPGTASSVRLTGTPSSMTDADVQTLLVGLIGSKLSAPDPASTLFMIYFPANVVVSNDGLLCGTGDDAFYGYHSAAPYEGRDFAYAVVGDCTASVGDVTSTASHELIEGATDPYPAPSDGYSFDDALPSPWYVASGNEVADLCDGEDNVREDGFSLQRVWSTTSAAAGMNPCIPVPAGELFENVSASPATVVKVPARGSATFTLTGWSTGPLAPWALSLAPADTVDFQPETDLDGAPVGNGTTATLKLTAPASAKSGDVGGVYVYSGDDEHLWPVAIQVQ